MKESSIDKASEFLHQVRHQSRTCSSVRCVEYIDVDSIDINIINIVLGGLDSNNQIYIAIVVELKA